LPVSRVDLPVSRVELPVSRVELPVSRVELPVRPAGAVPTGNSRRRTGKSTESGVIR